MACANMKVKVKASVMMTYAPSLIYDSHRVFNYTYCIRKCALNNRLPKLVSSTFFASDSLVWSSSFCLTLLAAAYALSQNR